MSSNSNKQRNSFDGAIVFLIALFYILIHSVFIIYEMAITSYPAAYVILSNFDKSKMETLIAAILLSVSVARFMRPKV